MLTTIATFREPWEAHAFRSRLDAENIPAMVAHEHHVGVNRAKSTALGGVKVQVPLWFAEDALRVEQQARDGFYRSALETEFGDLDDDPRCPVCGSTRFLAEAALLARCVEPRGRVFDRSHRAARDLDLQVRELRQQIQAPIDWRR